MRKRARPITTIADIVDEARVRVGNDRDEFLAVWLRARAIADLEIMRYMRRVGVRPPAGFESKVRGVYSLTAPPSEEGWLRRRLGGLAGGQQR